MSGHFAPGVYVEELPAGLWAIKGVATSAAGFVGVTRRGPLHQPVRVASFEEFEEAFGRAEPGFELGLSVRQFFDNGGQNAYVVRVEDPERPRDGLLSLSGEKLSLLCLPGTVDPNALSEALAWCEAHRIFMIVDPPGEPSADGFASLPRSRNGAVYYPRILIADPADPKESQAVPPSGAVAGLFARTDASRGVWKAPVGTEASLVNVTGLALNLDENESAALVRRGVNPLRVLPHTGPVVWGGRTLAGTDGSDTEWKYVSVRRMALFVEESIHRGTHWTVFEPNDEPRWAKVRITVEEFLHGLFRQGAFQGTRPSEAYFVKCDATTMTQQDIDRGRLVILVGVAPLKPGEFILIRIEQRVGFPTSSPEPPEERPSRSAEQGLFVPPSSDVVLLVEESRGWTRWVRVQSLDQSGPDAPHYEVDRSTGQIRFGDGEHGRVPEPGQRIHAVYRTDARGAGNVESRLLSTERPATRGPRTGRRSGRNRS